MYQAYSRNESFLDLIKPLAAAAGETLRLPWPLLRPGWPVRKLAGILETFADLTVTHARPPFGIESVTLDNCPCKVTEEAAYSTPFATLLHFRKDTVAPQPRVLLAAPMSGHFATLLRATVKTMLVDHDVYITDWHNVRDVPLGEGRFDLGEFTGHVIKFLQVMGPGSHVVAVCQPCVPVLAAAALMAQDGDEAQPRSMTLMAGPVDTRVNPTKVNVLAVKRPIDWFERNLISNVPFSYKGARRRVYPGFMQLAAFLSMNLERHLRSFDDILVPCLTHDGISVWDTLAIGEYLNEIKPEARLLPAELKKRTRCRSICGEMHSGFGSLRSALPVNLQGDFPNFKVWKRAQADIDRITTIWRECLDLYGGPFLLGERSMADAMYAPVVTRFRTYHCQVGFRVRLILQENPGDARNDRMGEAAKQEPRQLEELEVEF